MMMQKEKLSHGNKWQEILTEFADRIVAGVRLDYPDPGDAGGRQGHFHTISLSEK